jgi:hypothetical protein
MRHARLLGVAGVLCALLPASVHAQAWLPQKGEGSVSVLFQDLFVEKHLLPDGSAIDVGHIRTRNLLLDVTYGLTDRVTISGILPFVVSGYDGSRPHRRNGVATADDGQMHGNWQDFRFDVRYNVARGAVTLTPFVGVVVPSHRYEYFAHAAPGRGLWEVQIGTYVGRLITSVPGLFVTGRYGYGFAQPLFGIRHNRSLGDVEVGYFIRPTIRVFGLGLGQVSHGGLDVGLNWMTALPPELREHHDRLSRANFADFGGGVQWSVRPSFDLFGSYVRTATGENAHALAHGLTVGATWTFSRKDIAFQSKNTTARVMPRCLCRKGM